MLRGALIGDLRDNCAMQIGWLTSNPKTTCRPSLHPLDRTEAQYTIRAVRSALETSRRPEIDRA